VRDGVAVYESGPRSRTIASVRIVLLGGPGSGKGTQGPSLAEALAVRYLSSGDLVRSEAERGSRLGQRLGEIADAGGLVPDDLVMEILDGPLADSGGGWVLDGYPRTTSQVDALDRRVGSIDAAVYLHVDEDELRQRLTSRSHEQDRADDRDVHVVDRRMAEFADQTLPVVDRYRAAGLLIEVDGTGSPEAIRERIRLAVVR
jgi:adenylate kinase